jgi:prepilin-type N-terminal cleavage/methylation domain-containing protein
MRKMNMKRKNEKGFSILETLVTMSLFLIVLSGVYVMVVHYGDVSRTEHSRLRMQQDSRFMMTHFTQEIKDAGAVLTIAHALMAEGDDHPLVGYAYFNGIFPLNQSDYPDGIIVASGDPHAVTFLEEPYERKDGEILTVESTEVGGYVPGEEWEIAPWQNGDKGILLHKEGYLVFKVEDAPSGGSTIEMRPELVYYSGLLNAKAGTSASAPTYTEDPTGTVAMGNTLKYEKGSPVIRLAYFAIYLFREVKHPRYEASERMVRQLIRISDTMGKDDPLLEHSTAEYSVISENIYDLQIAYRTYEIDPGDPETFTPATPMDSDFHFFAPGTATDTPTVRTKLLTQIRLIRLKQLDLDLVSTTGEYGGKEETFYHTIPAIGDQDTYEMPPGKYNVNILSLIIEPRNYNLYLKK